MHFASMTLGIFDFLIDWLTQFLIWIVGWIIDLLMFLISDLLYMVASHLLEIVDICQLIFRKLCGMDVYWYNNGGVSDGGGFNSGGTLGQRMEGIDPLMSMFTNETVTEVLIALSLVSVVMVIVACIIKIIQTEFSTEGSKNSKGAIFGQALKSLMLFFLVPICCIGGIGVSNALLKSIDRATSLSGEGSTMGSQILVAAASAQNVIREGGSLSESQWKAVGVNSPPTITDNNREQYANIIDIAFRSNKVINPDSFWGYQNLVLVKTYYDVPGMNFITLIGGALLACYTLLMASFGMIMRLFKATILYVISPPMVALMPLDGGSAFKSWRKNFVGQLLSAYGTVVGLNLLFIILPVVNNINLFGGEDFGGVNGAGANGHIASTFNSFCHLLFTLTGLFMLKDLSKMIGDMIGADDAAGAGAGMAGKVVGTAAKIGSVALGGAGAVAAKGIGAALSKGGHAKAGAAFGNLGNKLGQKSKGTIGSALNKGAGAIGLKTHFSEETDYDKAKKAKDAEETARKKRFENGEATMGDWVGAGVKRGAKEVAKAPVRLVGGLHGVAKGKGFKKGQAAAAEAASKTAAGIMDAWEDGGAEIRKKAAALPVQRAAAQSVVSTAKGTYQTAANVTGSGILGTVVGSLQSGDKASATEGISQIINALNSIAEKTEEQKDLIQKLQNLQGRVDSAGDEDQVKQLGTALGTSGNATMTGLNNSMATVHAQTQAVFNVTNTSRGLGTTKDIEGKLTQMAEQVARRMAPGRRKTSDEYKKALADAKQQIIGAYKAELEKYKKEQEEKK